jgi:hypothetical protein
MGLLTDYLGGLFSSTARIGIYGPPNAGKTTLANRISADWGDGSGGGTSATPHETRGARATEGVVIERETGSVTLDVVDTPGVTTSVDRDAFLERGMGESAADRRAREATAGITESLRRLREEMEGVVYVVDGSADPYDQVNGILVRVVEERNLPMVVLANKLDRPDADVDRVREAFPDYEVVPCSAERGTNIETVYDRLVDCFG